MPNSMTALAIAWVVGAGDLTELRDCPRLLGARVVIGGDRISIAQQDTRRQFGAGTRVLSLKWRGICRSRKTGRA